MSMEQQPWVDLTHPPFVVVSASGDLDMSAAPGLGRVLAGVVHDGARHVVVDLSDVGFVDSSGLAVLIRYRKLINAQAGQIRVVAPPNVRRLFEITGMVEPLAVCDSLEAALND